MTHFELQKKAFDQLELYFQGWQTDAPPKGVVCLVHGLGEHSGRYAHWAGMLNQAGYSMIAMDLRGHGKSGGQRGHVNSYEEYFKDVDLLVSEARVRFPGTHLFLYGHSLGGMITVDYILRKKPVYAGVIITALSNKSSLAEQKLKIFLVKMLEPVLPRLSMSTGLVPATLSRDPDVVSRYINDPLVHHQASLAWANATIGSIAFSDQHAPEWKLPLLIMHGELDKLGYAEGSREFAGNIKGDCTLKIWTGLFHEIHNEPEKEQVFEFTRVWLDQHSNT